MKISACAMIVFATSSILSDPAFAKNNFVFVCPEKLSQKAQEKQIKKVMEMTAIKTPEQSISAYAVAWKLLLKNNNCAGAE